ncbi:unnamed protein product [Pleuronectes platessa]|uniref:Uncharacterized protein n=1 Tax=Pleuronectes platessa TaxID=8262 RepID=A0A9N7ZEN7_PLEPL|nr:unnamed protein product [Pleuronectes platessa]
MSGERNASPTSPAPERKAKCCNLADARSRSSTTLPSSASHFHPREASSSSDESMNFPGKVTGVLLLVLLAAQANNSSPGATARQPCMCKTSQHMDDIQFSSSSSMTVNVDFIPESSTCGLHPPTKCNSEFVPDVVLVVRPVGAALSVSVSSRSSRHVRDTGFTHAGT